MSRKKGILIAASLTGLVLVTFLTLGFGNVIAGSADSTGLSATSSSATSVDAGSADTQQELQAWKQYSQELENTVRIMQQREAQYQQQLAAANQTIVQLQNEINRASPSRSRPFFEENDGFELGVFDD